MTFTATQKSAGFEPIPVGVHVGIASALIDLGLQGGGRYEPAKKMALTFDLPGVKNDRGEARTITQTYTCSMNPKANLRKLIESWFGKAFPTQEAADSFDLKALLGRAALVNVVHTPRADKIYANVSTVLSLPAGTDKPVLSGAPLFYSESMPQSERSAAYAKLPEWLQKKVDSQLRVATAASPAEATVDEDIPF